MRPGYRTTITVLLTLAAGFALGRGHALLTSGYFYEVRDRQVFESPNGTLEWRHVTKTTGLPFLDPGSTELEYGGRLVYSAKRMFQENLPFARDVVFDGRTVSWTDGELSYNLQIEQTKARNEPPKNAREATPAEDPTP